MAAAFYSGFDFCFLSCWLEEKTIIRAVLKSENIKSNFELLWLFIRFKEKMPNVIVIIILWAMQ